MVTRTRGAAPTELLHPKWNNLKSDVLLTRNNHNVSKDCYSGCTLESLALLYNNKCSVCERTRGFELEVDHFRPQKPRNNITNTLYNQPGYYWLTYEWLNLFPLCSKCNRKKSNKFPLLNNANRIIDAVNSQGLNPYYPNDILWLNQFEQPMLVNPEYDVTPEKHFIYLSNGIINGLTSPGIETVTLYDLNRKNLVLERKKIIDDILNDINYTLNNYLENKNINELRGGLGLVFYQLISMTSIDKPFSLFHTYIYKYFKYFIIQKISPNLRNIVLKYYKQYKVKYGLV